MSDDSFVREVDEELRQDKAKALWDRYGPLLIGLIILVVAATAAVVMYRSYTERQANASGDRFLSAIELAAAGKTDEAMAGLKSLEEDGYGSYPILARMRQAALAAQSGDSAGAVAAFDAAAADTAIPQAVRDMARLRAGFVLVDSGSYADVAARVETLTADTNPLRHSAREALGLAAWKEDRAADALALFEQILNDANAPAALSGRARMMSELIKSSGDVPVTKG
jgi:hypothetical protein